VHLLQHPDRHDMRDLTEGTIIRWPNESTLNVIVSNDGAGHFTTLPLCLVPDFIQHERVEPEPCYADTDVFVYSLVPLEAWQQVRPG
jgi:hypothetical protein